MDKKIQEREKIKFGVWSRGWECTLCSDKWWIALLLYFSHYFLLLITLSDCIVLFHLLSSGCTYLVWEREILCMYSKIAWAELKKKKKRKQSDFSWNYLISLKCMFTSLSWQTEGKMTCYITQWATSPLG